VSESKTPYELAIEAGAKRLAEVNYADEGFTYLGMAREILAAMLPHAIPERCDAELQERVTRRVSDLTTSYPNAVANGVNDGLALLRARMTPPAKPQYPPHVCDHRCNSMSGCHAWPSPAKPVDPPKPPADAEQVERVAMAIWDQAHALSWEEASPKARIHYRIKARAAIAAMGGGRRWGVYSDLGHWTVFNDVPLPLYMEKQDAERLASYIRENGHPDAEVREYVEQKVKTAEEIADECLAPIDIKEKHRRITAAIENARKGVSNGKPT
jgi:hypothetical protein